MSTISDFINTLCQKAGIPADNAALKDVLAHADLAKINIDPELETALNTGLHSIESAKNSREVREVLKAQILNGVDAEIDGLMNELGFDDVVKAEIKSEKNSGKRARLVTLRAKEIEAEKGKANSGDKNELQKTINDLKTALSNSTTAHTQSVEQLKKEHSNALTNFMIKNKLSGYQYGIPVDDVDVKVETAQALLNKALQQRAAKLLNENNQLVIKSLDGTDFFNEKNMKVNADEFIMGAIAPILKKSGGTQTPQQPAIQQQTTPYNGNGNGFVMNESALESIQTQLKTFAPAK